MRAIIRYILGLYGDNGKENGSYYVTMGQIVIGAILGNMEISSIYNPYIIDSLFSTMSMHVSIHGHVLE